MNRKLSVQREDGVIKLALGNDPENTMDMEVLQQLLIKISDITSDDDQLPVVIYSKGRNFTRGYDCSCHLVKDNQFLEGVVKIGMGIAQFIRNYDHPVICYQHGYVLGSGLELSFLCDYVVSDKNAIFGFPESKFDFPGIMIPPESLQKFASPNAVSIMARGISVNADEAMKSNIINEIGTLNDAISIAKDLDNEFFAKTKSTKLMDQNAIKNYIHYIHSKDTRTIRLKDLENYRNEKFY